MRLHYIYTIIILFCLTHSYGQDTGVKLIETPISDILEECTIGCASGSSTSDGRPLLWKTRDWSVSPDNEVKYNTSFKYKFISLSNAGTSTYSWVGVNEHGFSILNSNCGDLPGGDTGPSGGELMRDVLGNCLTINEFQLYLDSTNITGRKTRDNFAVIDSTGAAAIFETSDTIYWKFDAADSPNGFVIRTNFTINGGSSAGMDRYLRSEELINNFYYNDNLNHRSIIRTQMRDYSDSGSDPVSIPYDGVQMEGVPHGYIYCNNSICRQNSVSAAVVHGVLPNENPSLSTMWTLLGHPATTIALPYWPVGETPIEANGPETSALCDLSRDIRTYIFDSVYVDYVDTYKLKNNQGGGLWPCIFSLEDEIFEETENFLENTRILSEPEISSILRKEEYLANYGLSQLENCYNALKTGINISESVKIYPNPFISELNFSYYLANHSVVRIDIVSSLGKLMDILIDENQESGYYSLSKNTSQFSNGVYLIRFFANDEVYSKKLLKIN